MKPRPAFVSVLLVLSAALSAIGVRASTIVVPDDYTTVQEAIDAAIAADTVYVRIGTYYEHLVIGHSLTIKGEDRDATIIDGSGSGSVIYASVDYVTIDGLTVANGENGIELIANYTVDHFTIRNAVITGNTYGFQAGHNNSDTYDTIENCVFSHNAACFYAHQFGNSVIRNCEVFENGSGFIVGWGSYTTISGNTMHDNDGTCIHIDSGTYNTIEGNELYDNDGCGLSVGYVGANNTFRNNIVRDNASGICMGGPYVGGNVIYNNEIVNNVNQAYDLEGDNFWDNGYPSGGNFWSDYTGLDLYSGPDQDIPGSDGIGDTPYEVNVAGIDHYPHSPSPVALSATLDIKPGSCPNPLSLTPFMKSGADAKPRKGGVLPAAVLGTDQFDVTDIDISTLALEGVAPLRSNLEDVGAPGRNGEADGNGDPTSRAFRPSTASGGNDLGCECPGADPDGYMDLTLKFRTSEVAAVLGDAAPGDIVPLTLTGQLNDGTPFEGTSCVTIVGGGAARRDLLETNGVVLGGAVLNPRGAVARINYFLPQEELVRLTVYDVAGRVVEQLVAEVQAAGDHAVEWHVGRTPSGVYFYRLEVGTFTGTRKLLVLR